MNLIECKVGKEYKVEKIVSGINAKQRLSALGVVPETPIKVITKQMFGPIIIEIKGTRLALGRGLVSKIHVVDK